MDLPAHVGGAGDHSGARWAIPFPGVHLAGQGVGQPALVPARLGGVQVATTGTCHDRCAVATAVVTIQSCPWITSTGADPASRTIPWSSA